MVRFSNIVLAYLIIGTVMFGGGAIGFEEIGIAGAFVDDGAGGIAPDSDRTQNLKGIGGAIQSVVDQFAGPLVLVFNLIVALLGFLNWPITVLNSVNAPPIAVIGLGGSFTAAFYLSVIRVVRQSA